MTVTILKGDCRDLLRTLPDESVHCVVTSPPYWGLRDYGVAGQIGLEATFDAFIAEMVAVFREVRRVLRKDGTLWLNLGDCYGGPKGDTTGKIIFRKKGRDFGAATGGSCFAVTTAKQLMGMPWRVAFALQADGWWLRQDIIWAKPNPMPESVTDRCTKAHEYIFLLSKSARYYYDAEAIKEEATRPDHPIGRTAINGQGNGELSKHARFGNSDYRNKRSVWEVATAPFSEAHFATFPPELIEPCIKAGCPDKCCPHCGKGWERQTNRQFVPQQDVNQADGIRGAAEQKPMDASNGWQGFPRGTTRIETLGFQSTCSCPAHQPIGGTVLDPFGGAGTTGLVADRLQRDAILIELNPSYAAMAERRIQNDAPLFALVAAE